MEKSLLTTPILERLFKESQIFNFFQAARLLENYLLQYYSTGAPENLDDYLSQHLHFGITPTLQFCSASIDKVQELSISEDIAPLLRMQVNFLGLIGSDATLPTHYTELVLHSLREKDYALQDFLNIFQHRCIQLFYRMWKKYFFPINFEQAHWKNNSAPMEQLLFSLTGAQQPTSLKCFPKHLLLFYVGHFYNQSHSATALQQILADYFQIRVDIQQFQGEWVHLEQNVRSYLPEKDSQPLNNCLGINLISGSRIWRCQNKFRIKLGPLSRNQLANFLPKADSGNFTLLCHLVRGFVDNHLTFDIQISVKHTEVPILQLNTTSPAQLGFNTWLFSERFVEDVADTILDEVLCG